MTVSPKRPSDGYRQPQLRSEPRATHPLKRDFASENAEARRCEAADAELSQLPPVLFKLPNVKPQPAVKKRHPSAVMPSEDVRVDAPATHQVVPPPAPPAARKPEILHGRSAVDSQARTTVFGERHQPKMNSDQTGSSQVQSNDLETASSSPDAPGVHDTFHPPVPSATSRPRPDARPVGRTWMEAVVAHRTVLVLLGIVIGAAFWTSRRSGDAKDIESSIAKIDRALEIESSELINDFSISDSVEKTAITVSLDPPMTAAKPANLDSAELSLGAPTFTENNTPGKTVSTRTPGEPNIEPPSVPDLDDDEMTLEGASFFDASTVDLQTSQGRDKPGPDIVANASRGWRLVAIPAPTAE